MALLFCDSFDHWTALAEGQLKYSSCNTGTTAGGGRRSTRGLVNIGGSSGVSVSIPSAPATIIVGVAASLTALPSSGFNGLAGFSFKEGATVHVVVTVNGDGSIRVARATVNGTQIAASAAGLIQPNSYFYLEAKVTIHDTTGAVEIRMNGNSTPIINVTNVDTRNGGTSGLIDNFALGAFVNNTSLDDFYVCDTTGSVNNDFLGDVRVDCLLPNAAGNYTQFTPSAGSNFQNVDEVGNDGDTTYNESSTVGHKDSYDLTDLTALGTEDIKGLQVIAVAKKDDAGVRSLKVGIRSNTTDSVDAGTALGTGYVMIRRVHELNPDGNVTWTRTAVDAVEALVEVA